MTAAPIADLLRDALPEATVLTDDGVDGYEVSGLRPAAVVHVNTPEQVAVVLNLAGEQGWAVAPRGGGTMLDLGNPLARLDLVLDLSGLDTVIDYQPDDLTLTVQAGITVAAVERLLEQRGQMLALDVPLPERATVGGALATNAFGPRRLRYGTARDLVIGMKAALPSEGLVRSGGKVVKNVAGFDLAKLHIGGLGTAGVITEVTFKLWPAPPARGALVAVFGSCEAAFAAARELLRSQLFPAAVELAGPPASERLLPATGAEATPGGWLLAILFLGVAEAVRRQTRAATDVCTGTGSAGVATFEQPQDQRPFDRVRDYGRSAEHPTNLILRANVLPADTAKAIRIIEDAVGPLGSPAGIIAQPGSGVVRAHWPAAPADAVAETVRRLRDALRPLGGLMVERAPAGSLGNLDAWGLNGPDLALMRKLKQTYDSAGILNPGRYVGRL